MPILAIGSRADEAGFTLVELMVVMVIIGLMTAAAVMTIPDPRGRVTDDAEGLAARMVAARDLAIVGGRDIGVRIDGAGYDFSQRRPGGWEAVPAKALAPKRWGEGVEAVVDVEGGAMRFDGTGLATPGTVTLRREGASATVVVDSNGAVRVDAK